MVGSEYSILFNGYVFNPAEIKQFLSEGTKIIWFGDLETYDLKQFEEYSKAFLFQNYKSNCSKKFKIINGNIEGNEKNFKKICENRLFNSEQYLIEHSKDRNLIVEASAGTGKTTVMVDRIMYLMHTAENLEPSQIAMITFTNDATYQMKNRLQQALLTRYNLTKKQRYLEFLEMQSQMNITTIHGFALKVLKIFGLTHGFSKNIQISSFNYEIGQIISKLLNQLIVKNEDVPSQIGSNYYSTSRIAKEFWKRLVQLGYSEEQISEFDWGQSIDGQTNSFQNTLKYVLTRIDSEYSQKKSERNAVSVDDFLRDLNKILTPSELGDSRLDLKYLFVDEFQDSDNSQIEVITKIAKYCGVSLFVVGDIKQSIYRFRGADDSSVDTLKSHFQKYNLPYCEYSLINNYRSSDKILAKLNPIFQSMNKNGLLDYRQDAVAFFDYYGEASFPMLTDASESEKILANDIRQALDSLSRRVNPEKIKESDKVVLLVRKNKELYQLSEICEAAHIPAVIKKEGAFFISDPVRDFFSMVSSFVFQDAANKFNFIISPYSGFTDTIDVLSLEKLNGNQAMINNAIESLLSCTNWKKYEDRFKRYAPMTVFKEILENEPILENYISRKKCELTERKWPKDEMEEYVLTLAKQYQADLHKLQEILQRFATGDNSGLFRIYNYLKLMIETNREEESAEIDDDDDYRSVYAMTVHKAKGLEFDTVILPYTNNGYRLIADKEILVDSDKKIIGWKYTDALRGIQMQNDNYPALRTTENVNVKREEARIFYVAMTRAIHYLKVYISQNAKKNSWSEILLQSGAI